MTRDYSGFLPNAAPGGAAKPAPSRLQRLGWRGFFAQQMEADELSRAAPVRVSEVHRNGLHVLGETIDTTLPPQPDVTVGDWLVLNADETTGSRRLERIGLFKRRAPGKGRQIQLIAANVDTAFIVSSCNNDFNVARLERYIALSFEAGAAPVIVLTKPDLSDAPEQFAREAQAISDRVPVVVLNALGEGVREALSDWCAPGQTVVFLGSSGVGKSTLVNALAGRDMVATQGIREDDSKGRHTTTRRQLHVLEDGCAVVDTPGMREIQLADTEAGVAEMFADLQEIAEGCRFRDCQHESEPGCAVLAAIEAGEIDAQRLERWRKLVREEAFNSASLSERKSKGKALGKLIRGMQKHNPK